MLVLWCCISTFVAQGYVLGQLDKLVVGLLQNLCRASTDKVFVKLCDLYRYERTTQPDGVVPAKYRSDAERLLRRSDSEVRPLERTIVVLPCAALLSWSA